MKLRAVDHVAIVVHSIPDALRLFLDALGGEFVSGGDNPERGIRLVQLRVGGQKIELMQPLRADSYLQRHLDKRGQGFHHLTAFVDDLEAAIAELERSGYEFVGTDLGSRVWRETYLRPASGFGTLLQLVETDRAWDDPVDGITLERVLAGQVRFRDNVPTFEPDR